MNSTEVQNPRCKLNDKCLCLSCAFGSVLVCAKSAHVFQKLSYLLCGLCTSSSSSDTKAFLHFIVFSDSPTAYTVHCMHYGIILWAYLSELLVKDSHKHLSLMEKPQYCMLKSLDHTLPLRTCYGEIYGNIACKENG